ncbi:ribokinase [Actinokineospora sp. UTMC 2448]|uniref:ribokinase n=1 Tax=Actinokineospora sp. UTMC 2448 TaxID=2268449 RepID=UPI0021646BAB|nr:ribokinase [Actinokineospora sp. UTMC 2448]UVS82690.1 Ribokinase [Actinokineospora sp. UTMC 2448]
MGSVVAVLGSANADLVVAVPRRPGGGETVLGSDVRVLPGGKGANTAVAAARLGASVIFVGAVGDDAHGALLRESLTTAGVDVGRLRTADRPTGAAFITVTGDGENAIVVSPGANAALTPADVDLSGAAVLVASLEVPIPVVEHAVALAAASGVRAVVNLSPVAALSPATLAGLDPLIVNQHEAAAFGPLLDLGVRSAVVTRGADGADVITADGVRRVPAPRVTPLDTTGAGDAFAGALAHRLAEGDILAAAAEFACRVASISVTRAGAQPSYPTTAELRGDRR